MVKQDQPIFIDSKSFDPFPYYLTNEFVANTKILLTSAISS